MVSRGCALTALVAFTDTGDVATTNVTRENALALAMVALEIARQLIALSQTESNDGTDEDG